MSQFLHILVYFHNFYNRNSNEFLVILFSCPTIALLFGWICFEVLKTFQFIYVLNFNILYLINCLDYFRRPVCHIISGRVRRSDSFIWSEQRLWNYNSWYFISIWFTIHLKTTNFVFKYSQVCHKFLVFHVLEKTVWLYWWTLKQFGLIWYFLFQQKVFIDAELEDGENCIELTVIYFKPRDSIEWDPFYFYVFIFIRFMQCIIKTMLRIKLTDE